MRIERLQECQTCGGIYSVQELNRINPIPFNELIVCNTCYEWKAWTIQGNLTGKIVTS